MRRKCLKVRERGHKGIEKCRLVDIYLYRDKKEEMKREDRGKEMVNAEKGLEREKERKKKENL